MIRRRGGPWRPGRGAGGGSARGRARVRPVSRSWTVAPAASVGGAEMLGTVATRGAPADEVGRGGSRHGLFGFARSRRGRTGQAALAEVVERLHGVPMLALDPAAVAEQAVQRLEGHRLGGVGLGCVGKLAGGDQVAQHLRLQPVGTALAPQTGNRPANVSRAADRLQNLSGVAFGFYSTAHSAVPQGGSRAAPATAALHLVKPRRNSGGPKRHILTTTCLPPTAAMSTAGQARNRGPRPAYRQMDPGNRQALGHPPKASRCACHRRWVGRSGSAGGLRLNRNRRLAKDFGGASLKTATAWLMLAQRAALTQAGQNNQTYEE